VKYLIKKVIKNLIQEKSEPLISVNISKSALLHNLKEFKNIKPENSLFPVLKSNAYGHGLLEVANLLKDKIELFIVDSYFEAQTLRSRGIRNPILIIGFVRPEIMRLSKLKNISFTITSIESLYQINFKTKIHLKIDTGMNRQGILHEELGKAFLYIKNNKNIDLEGICSHLSDADSVNPNYTNRQINIWNSLVEKTKNEFLEIKYFHLSNTYGHKFANRINANAGRLGIGLYGLAQIENLDLKPVMEVNTIITSIKKIRKGDMVGYNNTFIAEKDMTIATIPFGYYEGLDRNLSNKGFIKINNTFCPIVGRISMNITTIDVSNIKDLKIGDVVNIISKNPSDKNSVKYMTELSERISYELVVKIPAHLKRIVVD
jgi:alanine racemase